MRNRFSVIVPLYNKAPYIKKALESIFSQSFTDWELIIIDDGSADNSAAICEEFLHSLTPSCVHSFRIIHQNNRGVATARNRGVMESNGDYLCFLDADDWWKPEFLTEMDKLIQEYPDAGLYATNYIYYKIGKTHVVLNIPRGYMNYPQAYLNSNAMPIWTGATCMSRKVFDVMGGFPADIKLGEDFLLWAKIALHYPVAYSEKALAYYNNDVPASLRATRSLHAPNHHMLFNLADIEESVINSPYHGEWKALLDKLRVKGLLQYWLSDKYHDAAAEELKKVDWSKQPKSSVRLYKTPIWLLRAKQSFMRVGSFLKQKLIKASYSKANILFVLFTLAIFVKCVLFNWLCFSTQEENYLLTLLMSLPQKVVPALCIASFVFIAKRQIWTVVVNLLIDIWLIANLLYFKANGYFLSYEVMTMVDNMDGFWDSLLSYIGWDIAVFPIVTLVYAILIPYQNLGKCKYWHTLIVILLALSINIVDQALHKLNQVKIGRQSSVQLHECLPFSHVYTYADAEWIDYNVWSMQYVKKFSIVSYLPACVMYRYMAPLQKLELINIDESRLTPFFSTTQTKECSPKTNLVFLMVESLESWPLNPVAGVEFMPNVNAIAHDNHTLCCRNIKPQVKHGNSSDGQLIGLTGLLPITDGVVCNSFYNNTYPSLAQCYNYSAIINPWHGVWKQDKMTSAYHFDALIEPKPKEKWLDADIATHIIQYIDTVSQPFCLLGITISSHVPFAYGSVNPKYKIDDMPEQLNAYLNCLIYADSCIGAIYRHIIQSEELATTTTLVITGDHTIFRTYDEAIDIYAKKQNLDLQISKTYTPLMIYSPSISGNIQIPDTCYQMDIYPTIMYLIGCEEYYWKGFGVNLADSSAIHDRPIKEKDAYELSDMLIRSNYFKNDKHLKSRDDI